MFGEPFTDEVVVWCLTSMAWQAFNCWICHLVITKVGMIFIDAEILRAGNDQLLNELEEGVIILQDDTKEMMFSNSAANQISFVEPAQHSGPQTQPPNQRLNNLHLDLKIFAKIDKNLFNQTIIDRDKVVESINAAEDYKTLYEVIQTHVDAISANKEDERQIYKIHNYNLDVDKSHHSLPEIDSTSKQILGNQESAQDSIGLKNEFFTVRVK